MSVSRKSLSRRTRAARRGCDVGPPAPRCHGPRVLAAGEDRRQTAGSLPGDLCAERDGDGVLDAGRGGRHVRAVADSGAAGAVSQSTPRAVGARLVLARRSRRRLRVVSDRNASRREKRNRGPGEHVDGPGAGAGIRQVHATGVARTLDGPQGARRGMHRRPQLRLHADDLLAHTDDAAADGEQSAGGVRTDVRRQRFGRSRRRGSRACGRARASWIR